MPLEQSLDSTGLLYMYGVACITTNTAQRSVRTRA
jgi:hypothetical protein